MKRQSTPRSEAVAFLEQPAPREDDGRPVRFRAGRPSRLSDETLAVLAQAGDRAALELLVRRYEPVVRALAQNFYLAGGDRDDVLQEGRVGLLKGVAMFDPSRSGFGLYARISIERQIITAVKASRRLKHRALTDAARELRLDDSGERVDAVDALHAPGPSIEQHLETRESLAGMVACLPALSPLEREALARRLNDVAYCAGGRTDKRIDNALQRARDKLRRAA